MPGRAVAALEVVEEEVVFRGARDDALERLGRELGAAELRLLELGEPEQDRHPLLIVDLRVRLTAEHVGRGDVVLLRDRDRLETTQRIHHVGKSRCACSYCFFASTRLYVRSSR